MGLDMFLYRKVHVWHDEKDKLTISGLHTAVDASRVSYIAEEVCCWRKMNAIHKWFVENVQDGNDDCGTYYVDSEKLQNLLDLINLVLDDRSKAAELLPTQGGFFFGATDYNEDYFKELERTKPILEAAIKDIGEGEGQEYEYFSSW